ncbi:MAG: hypothetical protein GY930_01460 [bacterium]|nr:hypothetical protein [bacterium]
MKILLLSILASFIVSFATVQALRPSTEESTTSSMEPAKAAPTASLQDELHALAEANSALSNRIAFLENQPSNAVRIPAETDWVPREEFLALQEELRAATKSMASNRMAAGDPTHPMFRDQVENVLGEIRKDALVNRSTVQQDKRTANLEPTLAKMQSRLGLNQSQVTEMRTALESKIAMDAELTQRWRDGESNEVLGQVKRDNRATHQAELERILTPSQLEQHRTPRTGK